MRCTAYVIRSLFLAAAPAFSGEPERRAIDYLAREVPSWSAANKCFSCHNNGDGARALYTASRLRYSLPETALADTTAWLADPGSWGQGRAGASISDKKLARIQFAAALSDALDAGRLPGKAPLLRAAEALASDQTKDGSWQVEGEDNVGSPATWGATLATAMARQTLARASQERFKDSIARADAWLGKADPRSLLDIAAILIGVPGRNAGLVPRIAAAQTNGGGWGPWPNTPPEPFDTAVVLLALRGLNEPAKTGAMARRGRAYLIATQQKEGGWPETTRPAGSQSYAQHISTSAWATLALLATDPEQ